MSARLVDWHVASLVVGLSSPRSCACALLKKLKSVLHRIALPIGSDLPRVTWSVRQAITRVDRPRTFICKCWRMGQVLFFDALEQNVLQLHAEVLATEVNLYRALSGGWTSKDHVAQL